MAAPETTLVEELMRGAGARAGLVALGGGFPAEELLPREELKCAFEQVVASPRCSGFQYGWPEGNARLRAWIAARLRARGAAVDEQEVLITSGAQQALAIASEMLLGKDSRVEVDGETYPAAIELFRARGARLQPDGSDPAFAYVVPSVTNPSGTGMSPERRAALLASPTPIVADEAYAELRFDGVLERPMLADARDRTWHVGTFSKTLCPGLRVGFLVPPVEHVAAARRLKQSCDLQAGSLSQAMLEALLEHDDFDLRLERARAFYRQRADALLQAIRTTFPRWRLREPEGGFSIFVETDVHGDEAKLLSYAVNEGVSFDPGSLFRTTSDVAPIGMRLCFSSGKPSRLREGVRRLERAWRRLVST